MKLYMVTPNADQGGAHAAQARDPLQTQQLKSGGSPIRYFDSQQPRGPKYYAATDPPCWPGIFRKLPHQFQKLNGALAGVRSRGFQQDATYRTVSPPNPLTQNWYVQQRSTRTTSQKFNGSNTGLYIPAVFVSTAPINQRGTYSA